MAQGEDLVTSVLSLVRALAHQRTCILEIWKCEALWRWKED